jgi:hypothetical protein
LHRAVVTEVTTTVRLRRWALQALGGGRVPALNEASLGADAWSAFLVHEPCAGPLLAALRRSGGDRALPAAVRAVLADAERRDAERALRAERDARHLGVLARP